MASRTTSQRLQSVIGRVRPVCEYAGSTSSRTTTIRQFSVSASRPDTRWETERDERPRWSYTPEEMKSPYQLRPLDAAPKKEFKCNEDPRRLDQFYIDFLGPGGDKVLTEEVKWLAVTHKSFDQGRRGFNDRLAFLGRRILQLHTNIGLVNAPTTPKDLQYLDQRVPFTHPALDGLSNLANTTVGDVLTKERLATIASQAGMMRIMRWKPRMVDNFRSSGSEVVLNTCLYAIIGAIALQKGGAVAEKVAKEKILKPLGIS